MRIRLPRIALITPVVVAAFVVNGRQPAVQAQPAFTIVHAFTGGNDGMPTTGLLSDWDGTLYGVSWAPTAGHKAFGLTPDNQYFWYGDIPSNGHSMYPYESVQLIKGWDGRFYGVTNSGGALQRGSIFSVEPDLQESYRILHEFSGPDGAYPRSPLLQADDGNIYGMTNTGVGAVGTVFRLKLDGTLTTLHAFGGPGDGGNPLGALIQASDGNLYGTTYSSGPGCCSGNVFRLTLDGIETILHQFDTSDPGGYEPRDGLMEASDGFLYGRTVDHIFRMWLDGSEYSVLHHFATGGGRGELIEGPDGNLYGTVVGEQVFGRLTIFRVTPTGEYTPLWTSDTFEGNYPGGPLVIGLDGALYGTTRMAVFRFSVPWN